MSKSQIIEKLELNEIKGHTWYVQEASAHSGKGLWEGLMWLSKNGI